MSTTKDLQKIEHGDSVTVIDEQTGTAGSGETYSEALEKLVEQLRSTREIAELLEGADELSETARTINDIAATVERLNDTAAFIGHSKDVKERFEAEDVSPDDIDDAIEWARSQ